MAGDNKKTIGLDSESAKREVLNFLEKRELWLEKPYKIWISEPVPVEDLGYYFFAGPYREGESPDKHARKIAIEKRTGMVHLICVM